MFQSSHLLDGLENWDTNWARRVLKIPQEQLNRIRDIPEWSANQILTTENTTRKEVQVHIVTAEKEPLSQSATISEKLSLSNSSEKYINNSQVSNLQNIGNQLTRSESLNYLNLYDKPSEYSGLRSANSAPNIKELVLPCDNFASVEDCSISVTISQRSKISKSKFNPSEEKLKDPFTVARKFNKMDFCSTSFSQPEMDFRSSTSKSIEPVEKLADSILNHKYLKRSVNSAESDDTEPSVSVQEENNPNVLDKHMMLLEKRFSTPEECATAEENSKIEELPKPIFQAPPKDAELHEQHCVPIARTNPSDGHIQETSAMVQEPEINTNRDEKNDVSNYGHGSCRNEVVAAGDQMNVNHDETFGSQLIPCGQPLPKEGSQPKNTNIKTCDVSTNISNATPSTSAESKSIPSSPIVKIKKRKSKSKGETPKRIKNAHPIHFTADQVRNMLEMIKMFHSDI